METVEVLEIALNLANEKESNVRLVGPEGVIFRKKMTYLQLGTLLMTNCENIDYVKIKLLFHP